jgi:transposase
MTETSIGIDISKDHLDAHRLPGGEHDRFDNTSAGHKALIRWIGPIPTRVVYEPRAPIIGSWKYSLRRRECPSSK